MNDFKQGYNNLLKWFTENGGFINSNLELVSGANGRTFVTKGSITNELIISVPEKLILKPNDKFISSSSEDFTCKTLITLYHEFLDKSSFWRPFLDLLPGIEHFSQNPIYLYSKNELPNVSKFVTGYVETNYKQYLNYRDSFIQLNKKNKIFNSIDIDLFFRLFLICKTRMWSNIGLVPVLDFFQHSNKSESFLFRQESGLVEITNQSFEKDSEVFINYGTFDDLELFCTYGFLDHSGVNCHLLEFNFNHTEEKKVLVDKILSDMFFLYISNEGINLDLMRYLRVNLLSLEQLSDLMLKMSESKIGENLIDLQNESACLKVLKSRLQEDLKNVYIQKEINNSRKSVEISKFIDIYIKVLESSQKSISDYWSTFIN